ncbi:hypothetical protein R4Z10_14755 [Niallia sp. XMNu-256]|uniref:hypothetical protein n=1 Tax=Niallia sp. XMNu-256 TaxID=3082444 RepID=UPI0030CE2A1A
MTKLEGIRQRKKKISKNIFPFDKDWIKAMLYVENTLGRCFWMKQKQKQNKVQPKKLEETKPGYGDKKLEGPDRPST